MKDLSNMSYANSNTLNNIMQDDEFTQWNVCQD